MWIASCVIAYQLGRRGSSPGTPVVTGDSGAVQTGGAASGRKLTHRQRATADRLVEFVQTLDGDQLDRLLPEMVAGMDSRQVENMLGRIATEVPNGPRRRLARLELLEQWGRLDAGAAFDHISGLDDPKMRHDLKWRVIEGVASVDPRTALAAVDAIQSDAVAPGPEWAQEEPAAIMWRGLAASRDPEAALNVIADLHEAPLASRNGPPLDAASAITAVFENHPQKVIEWVESLPPGELRDRATAGLMDSWSEHDPDSAQLWLAGQPIR